MPPKKNPVSPSETTRKKKNSPRKNIAAPAKAALSLDADRFEFMFDQSIVAKSFTLPSGEMTVNQAFCNMLGYSLTELQNRHWQGITHPDDLEMSQSLNKSLLTGERDSARVTKRYLHKSGAVVWADVSACLCRDEAGQPLYIMVEINDITERKRVEQLLQESEQRYKLMFESAPLAINITHGSSITYANPSYLKMFGLSGLDELQNLAPLELFSPEFRPQIMENIRRRSEGLPVPSFYEVECLRKDGTRFPVLMYLTRSVFADGPATVGFILDITERKQAARQQEILYQVLRVVSTQQDPHLLAQSAAESLAAASGYPHVCLALPDEDGTHWVVRGAAGSLAAEMGAAYPIDQGVIGKVFKTGQAQWVRDSLGDPNYVRDVVASSAPALRSEMAVPVRSGGHVLAALNIESERPDAFDDADARMIQSVADIIALALENAQSFRKIQQDISERKQAQSLQQAVYQIASAAETTTSLEELYPQIHQIISSVMPAENFFIALYDQAQNLLRFPYFKDAADAPYMDGVNPGRGTTAYVLRTGKPLLCTRARHAKLERQGEVVLLGAPSAIWLGVPLIVAGKTIGAMVVQHYSDPNAYGEREQHILEFVSSQVAIAINRKRTEEALRESETRYRGLFENSPVSIWEEDFSLVKRHIEKLKESGVTDFRAYFTSHPDVLLECVHEIKVLDVNAASLALMGASRKDQLTGNLEQFIRIDASTEFMDELIRIAEGRTYFSWEGINYTLNGDKKYLSLHLSAAPGSEDTLERVMVSMMDITARKQAEESLRASETRYRGLFENSPVALWEQDFSAVKRHLEKLKQSGVTDFRTFFGSHPDVLSECVHEIKVLDVNAASLALMRASRKDQLTGNLDQRIRIDASMDFTDELIGIAEGRTDFSWEGINYTLDGEKKYISLHFSAEPGSEDTLENVMISTMDITARKRAEDALRESEIRYRGLFENSPVALWETDFSTVKQHIERLKQSGTMDFRAFLATHPQELKVFASEIKVLDVNQTALAMMRAAHKDQLLGSLSQAIRFEADQGFVDELVNIAAGQTDFAWDGINYTLDGEKQLVNLRWSVEPGFEDTLEKVLVSVIDITERKRAEDALRDSEEKFRSISEQMDELIYLTDDRGTITFLSPATESIFGYTAAEMQGRPFTDFLAEADIPKALASFNLSLSTGQPARNLELTMRCKDGSLFIGELNGTLYRTGALSGTLGLIRDITERKHAQMELEQAEARYRQLFENAMEGIFQTTPDGRFITANPALLSMLGFGSLAELNTSAINLEDKFYVQPGRRKEFLLQLEQAGEIAGFESEVYRKDGSTFWISENARRVPDSHGRPSYFEGTLTDISERKHAENQIIQLNASLEQRVEARTRELRDAQEKLVRQEKLATLGQLAGGVGHELRNPLGVINSAVYYLKLVQPEADEKIKKYHQMIEQEVHTAGMIINDLLDFGRVVTPDRQPVSISELLGRVLARFPVPATVQVSLDLPADLPQVQADPLQLEQVLGNLITNACQAMQAGGQLTLGGAPVAMDNQQWLRISVNDTGTGITPENMQRLFEPLFTTKLRGIGLGLAVSKKLVEANGGRITVQSEPGHGSTFSFYLPVKGS